MELLNNPSKIWEQDDFLGVHFLDPTGVLEIEVHQNTGAWLFNGVPEVFRVFQRSSTLQASEWQVCLLHSERLLSILRACRPSKPKA